MVKIFRFLTSPPVSVLLAQVSGEKIKTILICISREHEAYWSEAIAGGAPDWLKRAAKDAGIKTFTIKDNNSDIDKSAYIHFFAEKK